MSRPRWRRLTAVAAAAALACGGVFAVAQPSASAAVVTYGTRPMVAAGEIIGGSSANCLAHNGLSGNGQPVRLTPCTGNTDQRWQVEVVRYADPANQVRAHVRLKNISYNRCLDADGGTLVPFIDGQRADFTVQTWDCNGWQQQVWEVRPTTGGLWPHPGGARESRFYVPDVPRGAGRPFLLSAVPAGDGDAILTAADDDPIYGTRFNQAANIRVDSPGLQCVSQGFSGRIQYLVQAPTNPMHFDCL